ncbi:MAG TPA: S8 family serine peptidase, partial [Anaerolineales bacterium]|nr:S8 family serine peptidase [Anaerolineales bacterium]
MGTAPLSLGVGQSRGSEQDINTDTPSATDTGTSTDLPTDTLEPSFTPSFFPTDTEVPFTSTFEASATTTESPFPYTPSITSTVPPPKSIPSLKGKYSPDQVLVTLDQSTTQDSISTCLKFIHFSIKSTIPELDVYVLNVPKGQVAEAIGYLRGCSEIARADPNYLVEMTDVIPNDPGFANQYGLINIRAPQGWQINRGSAGVTIAIVDTGIEMSHPDLAPKLVAGHDFVNNDNNPDDDNGHGTHVAGIAAASTNNGSGVAGVSWGARLMPVKVLNAAGTGTYADVAQGIVWATNNGAQVINLSLGGPVPDSVLKNAVDYAYSNGVVVVAAAGNTGNNFVLYPAHYPNVIAVAATKYTNQRADFSSYGPEVSLSAPGDSIYSTQYGGG